MQDIFADIRPYEDHEVPLVLSRLLASKELRHALVRYFFPRLPKWAVPIASAIIFQRMKRSLKRTTTVADFQQWLTKLLVPMLKRSTTNIEVRGLEYLEKGKPYLWVSNHRDIAMDPLLINYSLLVEGWPTSRIAIGDNLLNHHNVADIMRLNKSFIVKRNISNGRQKLAELKRLSGYIRHSVEQQHSVWIAQREGRAKDGQDKTDTAVLKMLALHGRERDEDFATVMQHLNPVPVCIQYEWDPCDVLKARELVALHESGQYQKAADEDTRSILLGLTGQKGKVIVSFGQPLQADELQSAEEMAQAIDSQIQSMSEVFAVQQTALAILKREFAGYQQYVGEQWLDGQVERFKQRFSAEQEQVVERLLKTYAAPLLKD